MIEFSDEMKQQIDSAFADGFPIIATSVEADGQPALQFFGSAQSFGNDALAVWVRNREGGFMRRIGANPQVAFLYRNPGERVMYQFHGRARVVEDAGVRDQVFDRADPREQERDPERGGAAVVIDVDRVIFRGEVLMSRDGSQGPAAD